MIQLLHVNYRSYIMRCIDRLAANSGIDKAPMIESNMWGQCADSFMYN